MFNILMGLQNLAACHTLTYLEFPFCIPMMPALVCARQLPNLQHIALPILYHTRINENWKNYEYRAICETIRALPNLRDVRENEHNSAVIPQTADQIHIMRAVLPNELQDFLKQEGEEAEHDIENEGIATEIVTALNDDEAELVTHVRWSSASGSSLEDVQQFVRNHMERCRHLSRLTVSDPDVDLITLFTGLAPIMHKIEDLELLNIQGGLDLDALVGTNVSNLRKLSLSTDPNEDPEELLQQLQSIPSLRKLYLDSGESPLQYPWRKLEDIQPYLPALTYFWGTEEVVHPY